MELECRFCNTTFKNKCARLYHQRNAKYCLKLQGIESTNYVCSYCNKSLCEKRMLEIHEEKCRDSEDLKQYMLKKNLETLCELKDSYKEDIAHLKLTQEKELKLKYDQDITELKLKYDQEIMTLKEHIGQLEIRNSKLKNKLHYIKQSYKEIKLQNSEIIKKLQHVSFHSITQT